MVSVYRVRAEGSGHLEFGGTSENKWLDLNKKKIVNG